VVNSINLTGQGGSQPRRTVVKRYQLGPIATLACVDRGVQPEYSPSQLRGRKGASGKTAARVTNALAGTVPKTLRKWCARHQNAKNFVGPKHNRGRKNAGGKTAARVANANLLVTRPNNPSPTIPTWAGSSTLSASLTSTAKSGMSSAPLSASQAVVDQTVLCLPGHKELFASLATSAETSQTPRVVDAAPIHEQRRKPKKV